MLNGNIENEKHLEMKEEVQKLLPLLSSEKKTEFLRFVHFLKSETDTSKSKTFHLAFRVDESLIQVERDSEHARFILNELFEGFFCEDFDGTAESAQHIAYRYKRAQAYVNILFDYIFSIQETLAEMRAIIDDEFGLIDSVSAGESSN